MTNTQTKEIVFAESDKKHQRAVKKYDLSKLPTGTYEVTVKTSEKTYIQTVEL